MARAGVALLGLALLAAGCTADEPEPEPPAAPPAEPDDDVEAEDGPVAGGTLRVGLTIDPVSLDPRFLVDDEGELIVDALFDPLVRVDAEGELRPAAAEDWRIEDDGATFTFELRDAAFHDGTPVTADDFVRTFDRIMDGTADPPSFLAYLLADVRGAEAAQLEGDPLDGVEAVDERTLRIELDDPQPGFLTTLADPSLVPTPPGADDDLDAYAEQPIGNGAFAMAGPREPGAFVRLTAVGDHHDAPLLDEVLFTIYPDDGAGPWEDLLDGQLQVTSIPPERRDEAVERFGASSDGYTGPGLVDGIDSSLYLYGFDTTREPFDDARLRRALSLSIDRERIAEEVLDGTREPASSIVPPPFPGSQPDACEHCRHDPDAAALLLAEVVADLTGEPLPDDPEEHSTPDGGDEDLEPGEGAEGDDREGPDADESTSEGGVAVTEEGDTGQVSPPGVADDAADGEETGEALDGPDPAEVIGPVTLTHNRGATHAAVAERMAADIEEALGLEVDFQAEDLQPFVQAVRRGDTPVFRLGWDVADPDAGSYLYPLFHSSQVGMDNLTRYTSSEVDELLDAARASDDEQERRELHHEAERAVLDDAPAIPLLWNRLRVVVVPQVQDLRVSPFGRLELREAWLDPAAS